MKKILSLFMLGSVLFLFGCGSAEKIISDKPTQTELIKMYNSVETNYDLNNINELTIQDAVKIAFKNNPELKSFQLEVNALEFAAFQSGLLPNPELGIEAENIFGTNNFSAFKQGETTVSISQNILLAGKLKKRQKVSSLTTDLAAWDYEVKRLEVLTEVRRIFTRAIIIQKEILQNKELLKISKEFVNNLKSRVDAGKISPAEVSRADIIVNLIELNLENSNLEYSSQLNKLKSTLGDNSLKINNLSGAPFSILELPDYSELLTLVEQHPSLKRFDKEFEKQKAVIELEEANGIPDLTLSVGFRRFNETKDNAFVLGASIPLPLFDKNQGTIEEAKIRYDKVETEFIQIRNNLFSEFNILFQQIKNTFSAIKKLKEETIPSAKNAFQIIKEGNLLGKFTILDVLDSEKTLFELQNQYLKRLGELNINIIELEGLTGAEINKEGIK